MSALVMFLLRFADFTAAISTEYYFAIGPRGAHLDLGSSCSRRARAGCSNVCCSAAKRDDSSPASFFLQQNLTENKQKNKFVF
jgi:hypothetical protein